jgi:hypothetical protein
VKDINQIIEKYEDLRSGYHQHVKIRGGSKEDADKQALVSFEESFNSILADLVSVSAHIFGKRTQHDDRASSSVKARIALQINKGENKEFGRESSWSKCESLAAASEEYSKFLEERAFWYESNDTVQGITNSISSYLTAITHRIKL